MTRVTNLEELVELHRFCDDDQHLHLERYCGSNKISFRITRNNEVIAYGEIDTTLDDNCNYVNLLTHAMLKRDFFESITEYDNLIAETNPGKLK